ncbi:hypothetical protein EK904_014550 [Melospiza melodia maxima]|nr:hypothetical protein EK904_014550 [Melospiza melodia maxima]
MGSHRVKEVLKCSPMLLTCALPLATVNGTVMLESYTQPVLGNAPSCLVNPWCHQQEWRRRQEEEEEEGAAFQAYGFSGKGNEASYVTHAAYHGHIYSW